MLIINIYIADVLSEKEFPVPIIISLRNGSLQNEVLESAKSLSIPIVRLKVKVQQDVIFQLIQKYNEKKPTFVRIIKEWSRTNTPTLNALI